MHGIFRYIPLTLLSIMPFYLSKITYGGSCNYCNVLSDEITENLQFSIDTCNYDESTGYFETMCINQTNGIVRIYNTSDDTSTDTGCTGTNYKDYPCNYAVCDDSIPECEIYYISVDETSEEDCGGIYEKLFIYNVLTLNNRTCEPLIEAGWYQRYTFIEDEFIIESFYDGDCDNSNPNVIDKFKQGCNEINNQWLWVNIDPDVSITQTIVEDDNTICNYISFDGFLKNYATGVCFGTSISVNIAYEYECINENTVCLNEYYGGPSCDNTINGITKTGSECYVEGVNASKIECGGETCYIEIETEIGGCDGSPLLATYQPVPINVCENGLYCTYCNDDSFIYQCKIYDYVNDMVCGTTPITTIKYGQCTDFTVPQGTQLQDVFGIDTIDLNLFNITDSLTDITYGVSIIDAGVGSAPQSCIELGDIISTTNAGNDDDDGDNGVFIKIGFINIIVVGMIAMYIA